ncbi:MAG TPA: hypothetical protein VM261_00935 [Kofleriaceae bacterium]|nr:hypothetical protein [Kofleriaceae bacterium]
MTGRRTLGVLSILLLLAFGACGGSKGASTWQPQLAGTVTLVEVGEDGDTHEIAAGGSAEVDVNSRIELRVNPSAVAKAIAGRVALSDKIDAATKRLTTLTKLTEDQKAVIKEHDVLVTRQSTLERSAFVAKQQALGTLESKLADDVKAYVESQGYEEARLEAFYAAPGAQGVYEMLDSERQDAVAEAKELLDRLADLRWRMQATLSSSDKSVAIHLDGYDDYESGPYQRINKLIPNTEKLPEQLQQANQVTGDLASVRDKLLEKLRKQVKETVDLVREAILADVQRLEAFPDRVATIVKGVDGVKELVAAVKALAAQARVIEAACRPVLTAVAQARLRDIGLDDALICGKAIHAAVPEIEKQAGAVKAAIVRIRAATPAATAAVRAELDKLAADLDAFDTIEGVVTRAKDKWLAIVAVLQGHRAEATAPVWRDDKQLDRVVTDLVDTAIDLPRTGRKDGDRVEFRGVVVDKGVAVVMGSSTVMHVVRTGLYIDVSAAVLFLEPVDDKDDELEAAPAIVAAAHYRLRERGSCVRLRRFLNFVQPGIGLHFGSPDLGTSDPMAMTEDPALEMGVGGNLLLFGDLLQVGVGYDLQVGTEYAFVGFGLNTLGKLGVRVPL